MRLWNYFRIIGTWLPSRHLDMSGLGQGFKGYSCWKPLSILFKIRNTRHHPLGKKNLQPSVTRSHWYELSRFFQPGTLNPEPLNLGITFVALCRCPSIRKFEHEFTHSGLSAEWAFRSNWPNYIGCRICESKHLGGIKTVIICWNSSMTDLYTSKKVDVRIQFHIRFIGVT